MSYTVTLKQGHKKWTEKKPLSFLNPSAFSRILIFNTSLNIKKWVILVDEEFWVGTWGVFSFLFSVLLNWDV